MAHDGARKRKNIVPGRGDRHALPCTAWHRALISCRAVDVVSRALDAGLRALDAGPRLLDAGPGRASLMSGRTRWMQGRSARWMLSRTRWMPGGAHWIPGGARQMPGSIRLAPDDAGPRLMQGRSFSTYEGTLTPAAPPSMRDTLARSASLVHHDGSAAATTGLRPTLCPSCVQRFL